MTTQSKIAIPCGGAHLGNFGGFAVVLVCKGDAYGLFNSLTHDGPEPLVEFYDVRFANQPGFSTVGQFVVRYDLAKVQNHDDDLVMDGLEPSWSMTHKDLTAAKRAIEAFLRVEVMIAAIKALNPRPKGLPWSTYHEVDTDNFHLSTCACGVPCWQQPCVVCGFYPMGGRGTEKEHVEPQNDDERTRLRTRFEQLGGRRTLAEWYVSGWLKTAASASPGFCDRVHALMERAARIPTAPIEEIFAYCRAKANGD